MISFPLFNESFESNLRLIQGDRFDSYEEAIVKYGAAEIWVEVLTPEPIRVTPEMRERIAVMERDEEARTTMMQLNLVQTDDCFGDFSWRYQ